MYLINAILVGLKEIWAHKFRSLLTMLGIILGVSSLVGMSAIVKGMENGMKEALIALGGLDKVLTQEQDVPPEQEHKADQATGRTMQDVQALRKSPPLIRKISPCQAIQPAPRAKPSRASRIAAANAACRSASVGDWPGRLANWATKFQPRPVRVRAGSGRFPVAALRQTRVWTRP